MIRVKVCCIADAAEAHVAIAAGASAIGLVSEMPSGPGVIAEERIAEVARTVPPPIGTFLLTCRQRAEEIAAQQRRCGTNTIQLCDAVPATAYAELRAALPGIRLVQVIHVRDESSIDDALFAAEHADALLLDSGNPALAVKELGGTGRTHDWTLSARIRERVRVPLFLAGGLTAANVRRAIDVVQPFGVDVCSGVRTGGRLDGAKVEEFMSAALRI